MALYEVFLERREILYDNNPYLIFCLLLIHFYAGQGRFGLEHFLSMPIQRFCTKRGTAPKLLEEILVKDYRFLQGFVVCVVATKVSAQ